MKAREYAISLGLAKEGRGKLSAKAHEAIKQAIANGMEFDDYKDGKVVRNVSDSGNRRGVNRPDGDTLGATVRKAAEQEAIQEIKSRPVTHDYSTIYGVDTRGRSPIVIAFQYCSKCIVQIRYCSHEVPQLPDWIGGGNGMIAQPTQEEAEVIMAERLKAESAWESATI